MWPLIGGLISGGASLLGGIFSSKTAKDNTQANIAAQQAAQEDTQAFNAEQAAINRQWQEQMSNTAYTRSRHDLENAGLNPMMMFGSGGPASTPTGSSASVTTPNMALSHNVHPLANIGEAAGKAVNSAIAIKTFDKLSEEIANLQVQQARTAAETRTEEERPAYVRGGTAVERAREHQIITETQREANRMPEARLTGKMAEDVLNMPEWLRSLLVQSSFGGRKINDVISAITNSARAAAGFRRTFGERWSDFYR